MRKYSRFVPGRLSVTCSPLVGDYIGGFGRGGGHQTVKAAEYQVLLMLDK
jgi:hypothetical protein